MSGAMTSTTLPKRVGRYEIRSELGWGAAGRVFLALDPTVGRNVALKVMAPRVALTPAEEAELRERFLLEARAAGRLRHPNVVLVWDAGVDPESDRPYLAMELVDGVGLERLLARDKALPAELVAAIGAQVARALDHAHREGIVHRDVKPANIFLARDGLAKIGDFGIARVEGLALTRTGIVLGSPLYMSPEQVREDSLDGRSDVFSLAAVLFEAASGAPPFPGATLAAVTWRIAWGDPDTEAAERIAPPLRRVLLEALSRAPEARPTSGATFADALAAAAWLPKDDPEGRALVRDAVERVAGPRDVVLETAATTRLGKVSRRWSRRLPVLVASLAICLLAALALLASKRVPRHSPATPAAGSASSPSGPHTEPEQPNTATTGSSEPSRDQVPTPPERDLPLSQQRPAAPAPTTTPGFPEPPIDITEPIPIADEASLEVVMRLRLRQARLAIWIDGQRIWSEGVQGPRNVFVRVVGRDTAVRIPIAPGERTIEARLEGQSMDTTARTMLIARFEPGATRRLRLTLNPYTDRLDWK